MKPEEIAECLFETDLIKKEGVFVLCPFFWVTFLLMSYIIESFHRELEAGK
jgi:hypothetical protein